MRPGHGVELLLGPVDGPRGAGDAAELVGVGVADHHLLDVAAQLDEAAIGRDRQQLVEDGPGLAQLVDRLEERDHAEASDPVVHVDQTGLSRQHHDREEIVGAAGHGDDVALDDALAVAIGAVRAASKTARTSSASAGRSRTRGTRGRRRSSSWTRRAVRPGRSRSR